MRSCCRWWIWTLWVILACGCGESDETPLWTFMVYMAGDNNLSHAALRDLGEMEALGSSSRVNVVVQMDTLTTPTQRFEVHKGKSDLVEDLGERNMADGESLRDFVVWAKARFPARHYALILWNHGDGFAKALPISARILQDDTDGIGCCLSNKTVRQALEETGGRLDLLGLDASQMGQVETAYEFRNLANVLVFSQETGESNGWDYTAILNDLTHDPGMTGETLAGAIVTSYRAFYEDSGLPDYLTISAVRTEDLEGLAAGIDALAGGLLDALEGAAHDKIVAGIRTARGEAQELNLLTAPFTYVDLFDFLVRMEGQSFPEEVLSEVNALRGIKDSMILEEWHGNGRPRAAGLSLVFFRLPEALEFNGDDYAAYFEEERIQFATDTRWDEFLAVYNREAGG